MDHFSSPSTLVVSALCVRGTSLSHTLHLAMALWSLNLFWSLPPSLPSELTSCLLIAIALSDSYRLSKADCILDTYQCAGDDCTCKLQTSWREIKVRFNWLLWCAHLGKRRLSYRGVWHLRNNQLYSQKLPQKRSPYCWISNYFPYKIVWKSSWFYFDGSHFCTR